MELVKSILAFSGGTFKSRTKVMRGLHTPESARLFIDGWLVHYNFFRPHMSLRDRTPAQMAGIRSPFRNWKDITEQPYKITARIPMHRPKGISEKQVMPKCKRVRITPQPPRITPPRPKLSRINKG